jgi:hypothetical protein
MVNGLKWQTREGGVGIKTGQQSRGNVSISILNSLKDFIRKWLDFMLTELNRSRCVMGGVVLLNLHVEVKL